MRRSGLSKKGRCSSLFSSREAPGTADGSCDALLELEFTVKVAFELSSNLPGDSGSRNSGPTGRDNRRTKP